MPALPPASTRWRGTLLGGGNSRAIYRSFTGATGLGPATLLAAAFAMAALLLMVAWNMSEAHKWVDLLRHAPKTTSSGMLLCANH